MKTQHTSGPLQAHEGSLTVVTLIGNKPSWIACCGTPKLPLAEQIANTYLFAAAPDMLEALKQMVNVIECELTVAAQGCCPELAAARAAIAKAEGNHE